MFKKIRQFFVLVIVAATLAVASFPVGVLAQGSLGLDFRAVDEANIELTAIRVAQSDWDSWSADLEDNNFTAGARIVRDYGSLSNLNGKLRSLYVGKQFNDRNPEDSTHEYVLGVRFSNDQGDESCPNTITLNGEKTGGSVVLNIPLPSPNFDNPTPGAASCSGRLVAREFNFSEQDVSVINPGEEDNVPGGEEETEGTEAQQSCESQNSIFGIGWLICSVIHLFDAAITGMANVAIRLLDIDSQQIREDEGLKATWSYFRAIATFLLLAVGLAMVIGQAIGG